MLVKTSLEIWWCSNARKLEGHRSTGFQVILRFEVPLNGLGKIRNSEKIRIEVICEDLPQTPPQNLEHRFLRLKMGFRN